MKKFFETLATEMVFEMAEALRNCEETCGVVFHTAKYDVDVLLSLKANNTEMTEVVIYDEDGKDVTEKFNLFVEELKMQTPTYDEVMEQAKKDYEALLDPTERIFGSEANYWKYRNGK